MQIDLWKFHPNNWTASSEFGTYLRTRTFAARSYKQWVKRNLQTESQIPGPSEGWACAVKICHDGILEDTDSLDGAHIKCIECLKIYGVQICKILAEIKFMELTTWTRAAVDLGFLLFRFIYLNYIFKLISCASALYILYTNWPIVCVQLK